MKKYLYPFLTASAIFLGSFSVAFGISIFSVPQGGSGVGGASGFTTAGLLGASGINNFFTNATTTASCSGGTSCTAFTIIGPSPITISSTAGGTFNAIGLGFGATNTDYAILATTTSATNGVTSALTITHSGNIFTFTPSQSGTRTVPGGGTGATSLTGCLTGNGTGAITGSGTCVISTRALTVAGTANQITSSAGSQDLSADRTWTLSLPSLVIFPGNASTTQFSAQKAYFGGTATTTIDTAGAITVVTTNVNTIPNATTTNISISQSLGIAGNKIPEFFYPGFSVSTTTAWAGTTTLISLGVASIAETWDSVVCYTDVGTLNVQFKNNALLLNMFNASTTMGTTTFTSNNIFTAGAQRSVLIGTPATAPTTIGCTVKKHYTF